MPPERRLTDCRTSSLPGDLRLKQNLRSCHRPWNSISLEEKKKTSLQNQAQMCSELWDLKVRLLKRGIVFGDAHQRLSDGSTSRHTLRLCNEYDDLRQRWLKTLESRYSTCSNNNASTYIPRRPSDDDPGLSDGGDSTPRDGEVERSSFDVARRIREARKTGVPQNIGWRFSDDLEPIFRSISWHLHHKSEPIVRPHELKKPAMSSTVQVLEEHLEHEEEVVNKESEKPELTRPSSKRLSIYPASFGAFQLELLTVVTLPSAPKRSGASAAIPSPRPRRPELRIVSDHTNHHTTLYLAIY